jgi:hypothetical protein
VLARLSGTRRRPVIVQAVNDSAAGAGSLPEAEFLALCRRGGLPRPMLQVSRRDTDGRAYWADMRRQNAMWVSGERVLRFPAWTIRHQPDEVLETVRAALRAAGWPG